MAFVFAVSVLSLTAIADTYGAITIEREVLLAKGTGGDPQVIIRATDGGFVVVGAASGAAWAARTDAGGIQQWEYRDAPGSNATKGGPYSEFYGAVVLANNSVLLCGHTSAEKGQVGLLVRIDPTGKLVDQRYIRPNGDPKYYSTTIKKCVPWDDGFALLGLGNMRATERTDWLVKLDSSGNTLWEKTGADYAAEDVFETPAHDLVLAVLKGDAIKLVRIGRSGETRAERTIADSPFSSFVRSIVPRDVITLAILEPTRTKLHTLNLNFEDVGRPKTIETILFDRAYELADRSLAMFGRAEVSNNVTAAAIGRVDASGKLGSVHVFQPHVESFTVKDAVPLKTPGEFVAVRGSPQVDSPRQGILMSWLSIY